MRLRYLRLRDLPPLRDVRVRFGHEPVLGRKVAIRFVVGVNGSGKTRFLQALAETFFHLERPDFPPFPVTIAYDLARENDERTIYLRHDPHAPQETILFEFDRTMHDVEIEDWDELPAQVERDVRFEVRQVFTGGNLPGSGAINAMLPSAILAYTSGTTGVWEEMFAPPVEATSTLPMEPDAELERPFDWNLAAETRYQRELGINLSETTGEETGSGTLSVGATSFNTTSVGQFLHPDSLKLALCAAALTQAVEDFNRINQKGEQWFIKRIDDAVENDKPMAGFRGTLNAVDWLYPLTIGLGIRFEPERFDNELTEQLAKLYGAATTVLPDPLHQPGRLLLFDLRRPLPDRSARDISTAAALVEALAYKEKADPFAIFRRLPLVDTYGPGERGWWRKGIPIQIRTECAKTREEEKEPAAEPFCYTTFIHLSKIIDSQWLVFSQVLPQKFVKDKKKFLTDLSQLNTIRNYVMHPVKGVPITGDDFEFVRSFHHIIQEKNWRESIP